MVRRVQRHTGPIKLWISMLAAVKEDQTLLWEKYEDINTAAAAQPVKALNSSKSNESTV